MDRVQVGRWLDGWDLLRRDVPTDINVGVTNLHRYITADRI